MKHEEIKGKIAAFMDGEVKSDIRDEIVEHIASCTSCSAEYEALMSMDSYIKNTGNINPPAYFRENLDRKLREGNKKNFEFSILKLIPASAVLAAFVLFASSFLVVSPYIYASDGQKAPAQVADSFKSAFVTCMTASVFSPSAFAAFCESCSSNMCERCMKNNSNQKCQCGGHNHGK